NHSARALEAKLFFCAIVLTTLAAHPLTITCLAEDARRSAAHRREDARLRAGRHSRAPNVQSRDPARMRRTQMPGVQGMYEAHRTVERRAPQGIGRPGRAGPRTARSSARVPRRSGRPPTRSRSGVLVALRFLRSTAHDE